MTRPDEPTSLYRLLDGDGRLLYVGVAGNPGRRFEQHRGDKPWWGDVVTVTVEHHPTRLAALQAERSAIRTERPLHNVTHNRRTDKESAVAEKKPAPAPDRDRLLEVASNLPLRPDSLVGSFFLSHGDDDKVQWQGCVVAEPHPGVYLIETFSWLSGESWEQRLVRIDDMAGWKFYDTAEWMTSAYERQGDR